MSKKLILAISSAIIFVTSAAVSQNAPGNLERLGQFKTTGASPEIPIIPQIGPKADAIKKNLEKIMLPSAFQISRDDIPHKPSRNRWPRKEAQP